MVGRRDERDQLWEALHTATEQQSPQIVLLRGAAGCGKSRLAEWLTERAHEFGATIALKAIHNALPGPGDGLGPMCARFFGCVDLPHKDTIARLKSLFRDGPAAIAAPQHEHTDPDWGAIAELFRPLPQSTPTPHEMDALLETFDDDDDDEGDAETLIFREPLCVRFGTSFERYETIRQLLAQLCQQRTVVLWLDDVQWGADALEFLLYLRQQTTHRLPLLILATVRDEDLDARPYEATMLEQLQAHDNTTTLAVEPQWPTRCLVICPREPARRRRSPGRRLSLGVPPSPLHRGNPPIQRSHRRGAHRLPLPGCQPHRGSHRRLLAGRRASDRAQRLPHRRAALVAGRRADEATGAAILRSALG